MILRGWTVVVQFFGFSQEGVPTRVSGIHIINAPMVYWPIHQIIMRILPDKIRKRLKLHTSLESLHSLIDKNCLPESLGGNLDIEDAMDSELLTKLFNNDIPYEGN